MDKLQRNTLHEKDLKEKSLNKIANKYKLTLAKIPPITTF